ncbi:NAD(P)/FAD-dependent oxidoreductase [Phormidesmis priestleyi]|nr:FAD-dependent oxidoreductase [Phormidesmis priestleyi]
MSYELFRHQESQNSSKMADSHFDIAVIGAGVAGLTCAQQLQQAGYKVVVVEKSRGLGGRLATRRLQGTHADHGVCYLKPKDDRFKALVEKLLERSILQVWTDTIHELDAEGQLIEPPDHAPRYASPTGISTIAKFLATGLNIWLNQRVEAIHLIDQGWALQFEPDERTPITNPASLTASAIVSAIPAPQALTLLEPVADVETLLTRLRSIQFSACISAIAVYSPQQNESALPWKAVTCAHDPAIGWVGLDSTKQNSPSQRVVIVQSTAAFASRHLEASDLQSIGQTLLDRAADLLAPWLKSPEILQVHRWRYAFPINPLAEKFLTANIRSPLLLTGDWCRGNRVESAFLAGLATSAQINSQLQSRSLVENFWETIA